MLALVAALAALRGEEAAGGRARVGWFTLAGGAFIGSLLAKEAYVGLPLAVAAVAWSKAGSLRAALRAGGWLLPALLLFFVVRLMVTRTAGASTGVAAAIALPGIWLQSLVVALLPYDLSIERLVAPGYLIPGWLAVGLMAGGTVVVHRRRLLWAEAATLRRILAGLAWMLTLLGPSAVVVQVQHVVADRYLYLPLAGLAVALASAAGLAVRAATGKRLLRLVMAGAAAFWALTLLLVDIVQVPVWRNNWTLYTHAAEMTPESSMARYRLGFLHATRGDCTTALPLFAQAIALDSANARAWNNRGVCLFRLGRSAEAAAAFEQALRATNGAHIGAWYNLGLARLALGRRQEGCAAVTQALQLNPGYAAARATHDETCREEP